ncbi:MAG TPA: M6 family metalloprotease domain-containing protein [Longimicrobiales bacterium]|nr:M6 family metalloprotease domain-containing protein [Longimicrobiales bacterium]
MSRIRTGGRWVVMALAALGSLGAPAAAQHIAPPEQARGVSIPQAYFRRLARDPTAFTLPNGLFRTAADGRPMAGETFGAKGMVVLPALFADSPTPHVSHVAIQQALFTGPSARGTLTQAYEEMSRGLFTVDGTVLPWVRTSLTRYQVVGDTSGLGVDARVGEYLLEALALADADIDFGQYDNNGPDGIPNSGDDDGVVDAMAFEFIEVSGSCGGPGIWPHLWGISARNDGEPYHSDDPAADGTFIRVDAYIVQSAVTCGGVEIQGAETIAHEFGHVLGLPDYYHPTAAGGADGRRWVLGCWELMAAGSWGCGPHGTSRAPFGPTHLSARSKNALGWLSYVTVADAWDQELVLDPVQTTGQALRIPLDGVGREFLLVEYRTRTGFDRDIPADGVMIYHQDFQGWTRPDLQRGVPYFVSVVEQDHDNGLLRNTYEGGNRGEAGDAWGVDGAVQKLNAATVPALLRHAGGASTVAFHSIEVKDGRAHIRLSNGTVPRLVAPSAPLQVSQVVSFEERVRVAGGTIPYSVEATLPQGMTAFADGDEVVLGGSITSSGPMQLLLRVTDAVGLASDQLTVPMTVGEWIVTEARLLQRFLLSGAEPLSAVEASYLDVVGNANGRYDVGDLRAWLRSHPGG